MIGVISAAVFLLSFFGIVLIVLSKLPLLEDAFCQAPLEDGGVTPKIKNTLKKINPLKNFSFEVFLHKVLSKTRIFTLRFENKTYNWLQALRQRSKNKILENDNYWRELKELKESNNKKRQKRRKK